MPVMNVNPDAKIDMALMAVLAGSVEVEQPLRDGPSGLDGWMAGWVCLWFSRAWEVFPRKPFSTKVSWFVPKASWGAVLGTSPCLDLCQHSQELMS